MNLVPELGMHNTLIILIAFPITTPFVDYTGEPIAGVQLFIFHDLLACVRL